ncbi:MAG TPA: GNAT family N-acetyltransferase [Pseudolabrys sp.]|nr:GNAT family N-acetyltransferase [Pseudolabrys sp.]
MSQDSGLVLPQHIGAPAEVSYSGEAKADFGPLARDRIPVRSMMECDLRALVAIDRRIMGVEREEYYRGKLAEALTESDVRVSLVAEVDNVPVGFVMARVDLGEFGRVETTAVIDTIGVDPEYRDKGVGRALISQLLANLSTLRVERVRTEVDWQNRDLLAYLDRSGFLPSQRLCFNRPLV